MMHVNVLVIDDRWAQRAGTYQRLAKVFSENSLVAGGIEVRLDFCKHIDQIPVLMRAKPYALILLDVVLSDWKRPGNTSDYYRATDVFARLSHEPHKVPVVLLSAEWASVDVKEIVRVWPNICRMFIHWEELESPKLVEHGSLIGVALSLRKIIEEHNTLDLSFNLGPDDPIRIVHMSDMQFGGFGKWKLALDAGHCATTIEQLWPHGPHFLALTGDIAETGLPSEFAAAQDWIARLVARFGWHLPSARVLLVPGNHDVCLPLASSGYLKLTKLADGKRQVDFVPKIHQESLDRYGYAPYLEFAAATSGIFPLVRSDSDARTTEASNAFCWMEPRFRHHGFVFFGFNTARPLVERAPTGRTVSEVGVEWLCDYGKEIISDCEAPPLFIGLSHHSPFEAPGEKGIENPEILRRLFSDLRRVGLWLHGHWHERKVDYQASKKLKVVVDRAPTPTLLPPALPKDELRGFTMIELGRKDGRIESCKIVAAEWRSGGLVVDSNSDNFAMDIDGLFRAGIAS